MTAGVVEAEGDQVLHAQLSHVAERHRVGAWVSFDDFVRELLEVQRHFNSECVCGLEVDC